MCTHIFDKFFNLPGRPLGACIATILKCPCLLFFKFIFKCSRKLLSTSADATAVLPCSSAASMVASQTQAVYRCTLHFFPAGFGPPCRPGIEFVKKLLLILVNLVIAAGPSFLSQISGSEWATFSVKGAEALTKYF